jgi:hypothetical protein
VASSACVACELNSYKSQPGNLEACTPCPSGLITYDTASVSAYSCVAGATGSTGSTSGSGNGNGNSEDADGSSNGSDNQSANDSIDSNSANSTVGTDGADGESSAVVPSAQNESDVPALTFNMSLGNFPVTSDVDSLKVQVIATCLMFDMMFYGLLIGVLVSWSA